MTTLTGFLCIDRRFIYEYERICSVVRSNDMQHNIPKWLSQVTMTRKGHALLTDVDPKLQTPSTATPDFLSYNRNPRADLIRVMHISLKLLSDRVSFHFPASPCLRHPITALITAHIYPRDTYHARADKPQP